MSMRSIYFLFLLLSLSLPFLHADGYAQEAKTEKKYDTGASDTEIKIGCTFPLSVYGGIAVKYADAIASYYRYVNDNGGVNGRKINFIILDDAFNTSFTVSQTRKLVEEEGVFMMAHSLGAAQNLSVRSYLNKKKVPAFMVLSSAPILNNPSQYPYMFPGGANSAYEMGMYVDFILKNYPDAKIAYLGGATEDGAPYLKTLKTKLKAAGKENQLVAVQTAYLTDATISSQMVALKESGANVFLSILAGPHVIQAIQEVKALGWKLDLHIVPTAASSRESVFDYTGWDVAKGLVSTLFAKDPMDPRWDNDPDMIAYKDYMRKYNPDQKINDVFFIACWGWARATVEILRLCGDNLTRENFVKIASNHTFAVPLALPGLSARMAPNDYNFFKKLYLGQFDGRLWQQIPLDKPAPIKLGQ